MACPHKKKKPVCVCLIRLHLNTFKLKTMLSGISLYINNAGESKGDLQYMDFILETFISQSVCFFYHR